MITRQKSSRSVIPPIEQEKTPKSKQTQQGNSQKIYNSKQTCKQKTTCKQKSSKVTDDNKTCERTKRTICKINSNKIYEDKQEPLNSRDVYEFTFDPNEEPPPQKKKRKKPTNKKKPKPKSVFFNNNYQRNVFKALEGLKGIVAEKSVASKALLNSKQMCKKQTSNFQITQSCAENSAKINLHKPQAMKTNLPTLPEDNETELPQENGLEIDYSPVNSPAHSKSPVLTPHHTSVRANLDISTQNNPLNLNDDFSFFDDIPIASSSMNSSSRHPTASPWRVEFQKLPIKWQADTYVKPNMTPALESSFINNFDEPRKKHVYTNLIPVSNEPLPEVEDLPRMVQPSIISFMKEVAERTANKNRRARSATPNAFDVSTHRTPKKLETPMKGTNNEAITPKKNSSLSNVSNSTNDTSDKENSKESMKHKNNNENVISTKTSRKEKDSDNTFFGFDDSENQENMSPVKKINQRVRALLPRSRAVLQEINNHKGPMRADLPSKTKFAPSSEIVNKLYEDIKSAADAPTLPKNVEKEALDTNTESLKDDDDQSVHLFEDIDVVHFGKPNRKSYGKSKRVMFRQQSVNESETNSSWAQSDREDSSEDDLADLNFKLPTVKSKRTRKKKLTVKQKILKKEEAEAEAWAKNFNSMCEDVDEFALVVE